MKNRQPTALYPLCLTEIGERFGFYGMRAIIILYLTKILLFTDTHSYAIFASFSSLLYLSPLLGGYLADNFLGMKKSTLMGGIILTLGYALLAIPGDRYLYDSLATIILGYGLYSPNIVTSIGQLYAQADSRREGGFSIFYAAVNLGAVIPPLFIASIIYQFGWHAGFLLSSASTAIATITYFVGFSESSLPYRNTLKTKFPINNILNTVFILIILLLTLPLFSQLLQTTQLANFVVFTVGGCTLAYIFNKTRSIPKNQSSGVRACLLLIVFSILFEMLLQQSAMSMTIFMEYNVNRNIGNWLMPTVMFQSLNPLFIILCSPILSKLWQWLEIRKINPSVPAKFASGTLLMGFGFAILSLAISASHTGQIDLGWIVFSYLFQSCGELLVTPVGLSMVTEVAPRQMAGLMMGMWYFSIAVGQVLAGFASQMTIDASGSREPLITGVTYAHTYGILGWVSIMGSLVLFLMVKQFRRMLLPNCGFNIETPLF